MAKKPFYVALIKMTEILGVMCNREGVIQAFTSKKKGSDYFEAAYNSGHNRGYEASMSACLNFIQFQPKIIKVNDTEDLTKLLGTGPYHNNSCRSISGFMNVITADIPNPDLESIFEAGETPRLISEETFDRAA
jgi:hypothetical protein